MFDDLVDQTLGGRREHAVFQVGDAGAGPRLNQKLFPSAGDEQREEVKLAILQPIVNYSLPDKWSISLSEMNVTYDWVKSAWTVLPLGIKLAKLVKFGNLQVQFSGADEYNFLDDFAAPRWAVNFTVKFFFPI